MKHIATTTELENWLAAGEELDMATCALSPDMAKLCIERMKVNRKVKPGHVAGLARDMKQGFWHTDNIRTLEFNGSGSFINGQHRCLAVLRSGYTIPKVIVVKGVEDGGYVDAGSCDRSVGDVFSIMGIRNALQAAAIARLGVIHDRELSHPNTRVTPAEAVKWYGSHPAIEEAITLTQSARKAVGESSLLGFLATMALPQCRDLMVWFLNVVSGKEVPGSTEEPAWALREKLLRHRAAEPHSKAWLHRTVRKALIIKAWNYTVRGRAVKQLVWKPIGRNPEPFPKPTFECED